MHSWLKAGAALLWDKALSLDPRLPRRCPPASGAQSQCLTGQARLPNPSHDISPFQDCPKLASSSASTCVLMPCSITAALSPWAPASPPYLPFPTQVLQCLSSGLCSLSTCVAACWLHSPKF